MKGIRRRGAGWQAYFRYRGTLYAQTFALTTEPDLMQAWIEESRALLRRGAPPIRAGTLAADARRYLQAVKAMPSIKTRRSEIQVWVDAFGQRARPTLRADELRAKRDDWILEGLAASTINHRLRALSNLYRVLDAGRPFAMNPVREVPEVDEPDPLPRGLPYNLIAAIIDAMPDRGQTKKGKKRSKASLSKARVRLMAYSGLPPATIKRIEPSRDIDWDHAAVFVRKREKGKGAKPAMLPMNEQAMNALREMKRLKAFGWFHTPSVNKSIQRGVQKVIEQLDECAARKPEYAGQIAAILPFLQDATLKDLRHSFLTGMMAATKNLPLVQRFAQHSSLAQTAVYAQRAIDPALREAQDAFAAFTQAAGTKAIPSTTEDA